MGATLQSAQSAFKLKTKKGEERHFEKNEENNRDIECVSIDIKSVSGSFSMFLRSWENERLVILINCYSAKRPSRASQFQ